MITNSQKLRKQINALIKSFETLKKLNVDPQTIEYINIAINDLEDAFIAEVNHENETK
ncbi:hypothetical protein UFOVP1118_45 [uncultured Caudovirales phage]|uniref:Uncharacterized protein n=1 Tax=uncultured Caudovirales phage TaxID=2100421 RepID=A0A6J5QMU6_9CAUD|nr:hypothetical protein UFOVP1118_45 [uncultured Caudovirales phage]